MTGVKDLETGEGPELSRWVQSNCMSPSTHGSFPATDRRGRRDRKCERTWPTALFPTYLRRLTPFRLLLKCRFSQWGFHGHSKLETTIHPKPKSLCCPSPNLFCLISTNHHLTYPLDLQIYLVSEVREGKAADSKVQTHYPNLTES